VPAPPSSRPIWRGVGRAEEYSPGVASNRHIPTVIVVGGGFGGLYAARALARRPLHVVLIDRVNYHLFQPLLYQVATAALSPGEIAEPLRAILRKYQNVEVLLGEVTSIDPATRRVTLSDGDGFDYDYLVLATGAQHSYFSHPEWESMAPGLKSLADALEMRRRIFLAFELAEREKDPAKRQALLLSLIHILTLPTTERV
jgi:NADH dehydrogenase